jgi:hypothetical protein
MVNYLKVFWKDLYAAGDAPLEPHTIDHFPTRYMDTVKQDDG